MNAVTAPASRPSGNASPIAHPRLFFSPAEDAAIRKRTTSGVGKLAFDQLLRNCEAYLDPCHPDHLDTGGDRRAFFGTGNWTSASGPKLCDLAFAAYVTGEIRWLDKVVRAIESVMADGPPAEISVGFAIRAGNRDPICVASLNGFLPFALDILHERLPEATRLACESFLRNEIVAHCRTYMADGAQSYRGGLGVNPFWHEWHTYAWTLGAIYDPTRADDREAMEEAVSILRRAIHMGVDDAGVIGEGPNYGQHDAYRWATTALLIRNLGLADFWREEPRFVRMLEHWVDILLPGRMQVANRCDTPPGLHHVWPLMIHAHVSGNPAVRDVCRQFVAHQLGPNGSAADALAEPLAWYPVFLDEEAYAQPPAEAGWPKAKAPAAFGVSIMRTGWEADDTFVSLLSSGRYKGTYIHQHVDAGHFTYYALGEAFSIETGYGDQRGRHHAVMMPRGEEPPHGPEAFGHMWFGGHNHAFASGSHCDYACVDIAAQWDCFWYYRHALFVRAPGADPYLVILDDCNYRAEWERYDWLLNTAPGNTISLDPDSLSACIHGRKHRLELAWSLPDEGDYPEPHTLELAQDVIGSDYRLGIGERPRLRAALHGHNGLLLTSLVPRRNGHPPVAAERMSGRLQFGMVLDFGDVRDTLVAAPVDRVFDMAGSSGEATLSLVRRNGDGDVTYSAAADGCALSADGVAHIPRQGSPAPLLERVH